MVRDLDDPTVFKIVETFLLILNTDGNLFFILNGLKRTVELNYLRT